MDAFVNDPNAAEPHRMVRGNWRTTTTNPAYYSVAPASGINASIFDMTMWVRANLGAFPDVMSPVFLSNLHTPIIDTPHGNYFNRWSGIEKAYYATGWRVFDYRGLRVVHHGGGVRGFRSEMVFVPDGNIGMVLLFNAESNLANDVVPTFLDNLTKSN
jgi:beta-lactamase class C